MNLDKIIALIYLLIARGYAFAPVVTRSTSFGFHKTSLFSQKFYYENPPLVAMVESEKRGFFSSKIVSATAGLVSGLCGYVTRGMAEDLEYAELPPPYVPALFGVVLLAGVGILTVSLGDVMTEGKLF